jgi:hypothetical protein
MVRGRLYRANDILEIGNTIMGTQRGNNFFSKRREGWIKGKSMT